MNIMIFDVPAESGGALSILNDVYKEAIENEDKSIKWFFILSKPFLLESENINVIRFPWIKKSWLHRYYFDNFIASKLVKEMNIDIVLSLQNIIVPHVKCKQVLYVHQSLPFVNYKFSFLDNKLYWIYQNIIGKKIINSIKNANKVIVQTEWMKQACINKSKIMDGKFEVIPPKVNIIEKKHFSSTKESLSTFFYPASGVKYKNHQIIINAARNLKKYFINNYEIVLTLKGNENEDIRKMYENVIKENLPIRFNGTMTKEEVFNMYTKSILIFPSYIESFGLPLLEARMHRSIVLAANTPFANEILKDYENYYTFNAFISEELSELMEKFINNKYKSKAIILKNKQINQTNKRILDQLL